MCTFFFLPLQNRRRTTMGKVFRKASRREEVVRLGKGSRSRAKIILKRIAQLHRVIHGTLPCVKIRNYKQAASLARSFRSCTRRRTDRRRKQRRVEKTGQLPFFWNVKHLECVSQDEEPLKVRSILRKSTNQLRPKRRVQFAPEALHSPEIQKRRTITRSDSTYSSSRAWLSRSQIRGPHPRRHLGNRAMGS